MTPLWVLLLVYGIWKVLASSNVLRIHRSDPDDKTVLIPTGDVANPLVGTVGAIRGRAQKTRLRWLGLIAVSVGALSAAIPSSVAAIAAVVWFVLSTLPVETTLGPPAVIAVSASIGLALDGPTGLALGALIGFGLAFAAGLVVRAFQGGSVPKAAREGVALRMLTNRAEELRQHFGNQTPRDHLRAVGNSIEEVAQRAVSTAPSRRAAFSYTVISRSLQEILAAAGSDAERAYLMALASELEAEWYPEIASQRSLEQ